jgi:hypothetical protein
MLTLASFQNLTLFMNMMSILLTLASGQNVDPVYEHIE